MKRLMVLLALACGLAMVSNAKSPKLRFGEDGSFKILQLTDLHLTPKCPEEAVKVYENMDFLIGSEKPDLVVITGDVVFGKPSEGLWNTLVAHLDSLRTPWCVVYGNHDWEQELTYPEMSSLIVKGRFCMDQLDAEGSLADVELPVYSSDGKSVPFYVYCMDSHNYSSLEEVKGYGWFTWEQVQWMRDRCKARISADGKVAPAVAFFHIPLRQYIDAWSYHENPRKGASDKSAGVGIRGENIACGCLDTGMFAAMREGGSVIGTFAGHDHDSDFVAVYQGMALAYGRFSGANTVYNNIPRGGRVILLHEGERGFETWIRDHEGRYINHVRFNGTKLEGAGRIPGYKKYGDQKGFKE